MAQICGRDAHCCAPPRSDPSKPDLGTRLPPWVFDVKALVGPRMQDAAAWEPVVNEAQHPLPRHAGSLAAQGKHTLPEDRHVVAERRKCPHVGWHCVVRKESRHDLPQPTSL